MERIMALVPVAVDGGRPGRKRYMHACLAFRAWCSALELLPLVPRGVFFEAALQSGDRHVRIALTRN